MEKLDLDRKALELYEKMKGEFLQDEESKDVFARARNLVEPTLKEWADATIAYKLGPDGDRQINKDILKSCMNTIDNVQSGAKTYLKNYALEKLGSLLKRVAVKYILPIVL